MIRTASRFLAVLLVIFAMPAIGPAIAPAYAKETFKFEDYFRGKTVAYGKFSAINGVRRTFRVDLRGTWNGKTLKLVEDFAYDDGVKERKIW
ncbi:MAG: DUF3833 family protein, partial [Pseudomonadota bacterium]